MPETPIVAKCPQCEQERELYEFQGQTLCLKCVRREMKKD